MNIQKGNQRTGRLDGDSVSWSLVSPETLLLSSVSSAACHCFDSAVVRLHIEAAFAGLVGCQSNVVQRLYDLDSTPVLHTLDSSTNWEV